MVADGTAYSFLEPLRLRTNVFNFRNRRHALDVQRKLSAFVVDQTPSAFKGRLVCGLDASYNGELGFASAVTWNLESLKVAERAVFEGPVKVDYMPGLLGFREGPLLVSAARRLRSHADVFFVDGHGRAHPRRFGSACHVGLALDRPTIGVAKSLLYGETKDGNIISPNGEILGRVILTGTGKACYVSVGHRIGLDDAARLVKLCLLNDRPVPLEMAHNECSRLRSLAA